MRHRSQVTIAIALTAGLSQTVALDGSAHPGHHEPAPGTQPPSVASAHDPGRPAPSTAPSGDPLDLDPTLIFDPVPNDTIGVCRWRRASMMTGIGGVHVQCEPEEIPITSAIYLPDYANDPHAGLVNLSPSWDDDGEVDGLGLSDDHPWAHGEPPPDGTRTQSYSLPGSGMSIHHELVSGIDEDDELAALCCQTLPPKPGIGALNDCHFETEMVEVVPETDPSLSGQYVAALACGSGRVASGGCFPQFFHGPVFGPATDHALTGSHPWVGGDTLEMPSGPHDTTPGPTGWACRLDHEPELGNDPLDFVEHIAVTVLCCD